MNDEERVEREVTLKISGEILTELERLALQDGLESVHPLVRQILWRHLYGAVGPQGFAERPFAGNDSGRQRVQRKTPSPDLRLAVLQRDNHRCVSCGASAADAALHMDHKLPVVKGGETVFENLQTLCESCNRAKAAKIIEFPTSAGNTDSIAS